MFNLDHNATTPVVPEVVDALSDALRRAEAWGNPSSVHSLGREARERVESARRQVAAGLGCEPLEVVFTSGGTEADNLAVRGSVEALANLGRPAGVMTSPIEHPAVLSAAKACAGRGHPWVTVAVDDRGRIGVDEVAACLHGHPEVGVVSLIAAHHELGNAYPIPEIVAAVRAVRDDVLIHTDAVQAVGKRPVEFAAWGVDLLSISGHKIGAPAGTGALLVRRGVRLETLMLGGQQERGFRSGTENVLGIIGLGRAVEVCTQRWDARLAALREQEIRLRAGLLALGGHIHGDPASRSGNTLFVSFEGCDGELLAMNLDLEGIAVSTGAACSSGSVEPSPTLLALGFSPRAAREGIRLSWAPSTPTAAVDHLLAVLPGAVERVREATAMEA